LPRPPTPELPAAVRWRAVALPVEHGGWGFLIEPGVLGLVIAPSFAGGALAAAALAAFLVRHPLRLVFMDRRRGARYPRTALAERFVLGYAAAALALLALGLALARQPFWPGLAAAAPFALAALGFDAAGRSREALPEALGAAALSHAAVVIALAGGAAAGAAWAATLLLAFRALASVLYVRARIRLDRGVAAGPWTVVIAHAAALAGAAALVALGWAPVLALVAFGVLLARAAWGVSPRRAVVPPRVLGWQELKFGLLTLALLALGYRLGA
jgi:hypothetical protein